MGGLSLNTTSVYATGIFDNFDQGHRQGVADAQDDFNAGRSYDSECVGHISYCVGYKAGYSR